MSAKVRSDLRTCPTSEESRRANPDHAKQSYVAVPTLQTELTEIVTGLGMLGIESLETALEARPPQMLNVTPEHFDRLARARDAGKHPGLFRGAWDNGRAFASSADGLHNRTPLRLEWKGTHHLPGDDPVPADLRVDYVYLVSCKYRSKVLYNPSPAHLFDRRLATRRGRRMDWYSEAVPLEYQELYLACRDYVADGGLPASVVALDRSHRLRLKAALSGQWPQKLVEPYRSFCIAVSQSSACRWQNALGNDPAIREEMLWRLLRLQSAPYFVLGMASGNRPVRYRVDTPWDFRRRYAFRSFEPRADTDAGQPTVRWQADLMDKLSATPVHVEGHVEVRWSHGRFGGAPEAKVYLDTPHERTPGYAPLRCMGKEPSGQLPLL